MRKIFLGLVFCFLVFSCVSIKEYKKTKNNVYELQVKNNQLNQEILIEKAFDEYNSLKEKFELNIAKNSVDMDDSLYVEYKKHENIFSKDKDEYLKSIAIEEQYKGYPIKNKQIINSDLILEMKSLNQELESKVLDLDSYYETKSFFDRMYNQPCSEEFIFDAYLIKNDKLKDCVEKIKKAAINLSDENKIKYFNIRNDGVGIITDELKCDKNGNAIQNNGSLINTFFSTGDQYYKRYMITIEKNNNLNKVNRQLNTEIIDNTYTNYCKPKWSDIPELNILLKNEKNLFNEDYTLKVKIYIYKKHKQGEKIIELLKGFPVELIKDTKIIMSKNS